MGLLATLVLLAALLDGGVSSATPTPPPTEAGDVGIKRISSSFSVLSGIDPDFREIKVKVRNDSDHDVFVRVYLDANPPAGGGCTPNGRILSQLVFLSEGSQITPVFAQFGSLPGFVEFSCTNQAAVIGQSYQLVAVVDLNGDDSVECSAGNLFSLPCKDALALPLGFDDTDSDDNLKDRFAPRIKKP